MVLQSTTYTCGPCSVVNALHALGREESEATVTKLAGTSPIHGTPPRGIKRALTTLALRHTALTFRTERAAWTGLKRALLRGEPCLLLVQGNSHWVAAIGLVGDRVLFADSAQGDLVLSYDRLEALLTWRSPNKKPVFYMIRLDK